MSAEQAMTEAPVQHAPQAGGDSYEDSGSNGGGFELDSDGQRVPHGMGQSKSSRRRRRKRKGKGPEAGGEGGSEQAGSSAEGAPQVIPVMQGEAIAAAQQPRQGNGQARNFDRGDRNQQANGGQNPAPGQQQNAPGGTKRWKKKFRDRDRNTGSGGGGAQAGGFAQNGGQNGSSQNGGGQGFQQHSNGGGFRGPDTHQPGNSTGGFKRKGGFGGGGGKQQGRSRAGFVGPMDHSYRPANGNVFETSAPASESYGNFGNGGGGGRSRSYAGDSQPIDYSMGRAIPIAPGTPTRIYFFIEDLFFTAKIQETARKLGVKVAFIKNEKEQIATLTSGTEEDRPGLIVFDLNNASAKPLTLIPKLKTKLKKTTSIIGFLSHLQGDLKAKAVEAGCDTVMPRAAFSQNLPNLLRRYGIEEAEETNFNQ